MENKNKMVMKKIAHGKVSTVNIDLKEVTGKNKWVSIGKKNDGPNQLLNLYENSSAVHRILIQKRFKMIAAAGFDFSKLISPEAKIFFANKNGKKNLDKLTKDLAENISIFGGGYLCIKWSLPDENGKRFIAAIDNIPFEKVRAEERTVDDCVLNWYVCRNWLDKKYNTDPEWIAGFDPEDQLHFTQILPVFIPSAGMDYYPLPIYCAAITEIKNLQALGQFHLSSTENGFSVEHIFVHHGQYSDEQMDEIVNNFKGNYSGPDKAGESLHIFSSNVIPGLETQIIPVQRPDTDKRYLDLKGQLIDEVIIVHGATAMIAGKESGKAFTNDEIADAYNYFQLSEINDLQKLIEDEINMLAEINGITDQFILNKYNIIKPNTTNTVK